MGGLADTSKRAVFIVSDPKAVTEGIADDPILAVVITYRNDHRFLVGDKDRFTLRCGLDRLPEAQLSLDKS